MASLSESSLISDNENNKPQKTNNKKWFDSVYLCIEKTKNPKLIDGFACYKFDSFENADKHYNKIKPKLILEIKKTMVPICKWVPFIFHRSVINYKLKKLYWKNDITIMKKI